MAEKYKHTLLVVDDEAVVGKTIGNLLKSIDAQFAFMESAIMALDQIKDAAKPFSLIISDQRMPEMKGSDFLEKAKALSPESIRFLMSSYSDIDAIMDAVNKGSIHRFISKPWDNEILTDTIKAGLEQYDICRENHNLLNLAKEQNLKLHTLNKTLKKSTAAYKKKIREKDTQIEKFRNLLEKGFNTRDAIDDVGKFLKQRQLLDHEKLGLTYEVLVEELFEQFQNIATRRGLKMPAPSQEMSNAG